MAYNVYSEQPTFRLKWNTSSVFRNVVAQFIGQPGLINQVTTKISLGERLPQCLKLNEKSRLNGLTIISGMRGGALIESNR